MPLYPQESYGDDPSSYLTNPNTPGRQPSPFKAPEFVDPEYIEKFRELPDGSALFVVGEKAGDDEFPADSGDFYENLAEHLDDSVLDGLSEELMEAIQSDKDSRQEWENSASIILKYLGWDIDDYKTKSLCKAVDNTLSTTLMNFFAMAKEALFPSKGPAKGQVEGIPQEDMIERAERVAIFMNYFLTVMDKVYYPDKHRLILYVASVISK